MQSFKNYFLFCKPFIFPFAISLASHILIFFIIDYSSSLTVPKHFFPITSKNDYVEVSLFFKANKGMQTTDVKEEVKEEKKVEKKKVPDGFEKEKQLKKEKKVEKSVNSKKSSALAEKSVGNENIDNVADINGSASYVPEPTYPKVSLRNKQEGTVEIIIFIDELGNLLDYKVAKSSGYPKLDEAAMKVIPKARFAPASKGGKNVPSSLNLSFHFDIKKHYN